MGTSHGTRADRLLALAGYLLLLVLGFVQGVVGSFHYSNSPQPLIAILLDVLIFATCLLAGWGFGTVTAGLLPAVGWLIASFILAMPNSNGSVIITNSSAGQWYLYGGALAAAVGVAASFTVWARRATRSH